MADNFDSDHLRHNKSKRFLHTEKNSGHKSRFLAGDDLFQSSVGHDFISNVTGPLNGDMQLMAADLQSAYPSYSTGGLESYALNTASAYAGQYKSNNSLKYMIDNATWGDAQAAAQAAGYTTRFLNGSYASEHPNASFNAIQSYTPSYSGGTIYGDVMSNLASYGSNMYAPVPAPVPAPAPSTCQIPPQVSSMLASLQTQIKSIQNFIVQAQTNITNAQNTMYTAASTIQTKRGNVAQAQATYYAAQNFIASATAELQSAIQNVRTLINSVNIIQSNIQKAQTMQSQTMQTSNTPRIASGVSRFVNQS